MDTTMIAEVRSFIKQNYTLGNGHALSDSDSLLEHGVIDSTGVLELIEFLQEMYGIVGEDEELPADNLDVVENVAGYISRRLNGVAHSEVARVD